MRRSVRMMRQAISPRFAIRTLRNIRVPDQDFQRRRIVGVAGIVELRAIGDEHEEVHRGAHLDVFARARSRRPRSARPPSAVTGTFMKKLMLWVEIALGQTESLVLGDREQIAVAARVHGALLERVAHRVRLGRAGAAERVVPAHRVGDDFGQSAAFGGQQRRAHAQIDVALCADGVDDAISLCGIVRAEQQRVGGLIALHVDDPKSLSLPHDVDPVLARGDHLPVSRCVG